MRGSVPSNKVVISPQQSIQSQDSQTSKKIEWEILNQRLSKVQQILIKLQRKTSKIQKNITVHMVFQKQLQSSLTTIKEHQMQQPNQEYIKQTLIKQIQNDIKNTVKKGISILQSKSEQIIKQSQNGIIEQGYLLLMEQKLKQHFRKTQLYVQKMVDQLKNMINKKIIDKQKIDPYYQIPQKIQHGSRQISGSKSQRKQIQRIKQTSQQSKVEQRDNTSRVSYLKEKLIQFQKINKKYQKVAQQKQKNQNTSKKVVEKMNNIKNYLQQSQSQIQQSNIQQPFSNDQSLEKWRKIDQFTKKNTTT